MKSSFKRHSKGFRFFLLAVIFLCSVSAGTAYIALRWSLNDDQDLGLINGLIHSVKVTIDQHGIPAIAAQSRLDGFRALGYVTTQNRLFQMDLLRRHSAGRLAEIFGEVLVPLDQNQRILGFSGVTKEIMNNLPENQKEALEAYAEGVNSAIGSMPMLPFEFLVLRYRPEPWRIEDSLLIMLNMMQTLSNSQQEERMLTVMKQALPQEVFEFLTPMTDSYSQSVLQEKELSAHRVPTEAIISLLKTGHSGNTSTEYVKTSPIQVGSNAWAVAGSRTKDGRAILANDMHLDLSVPTLWFRCRLKYEGHDIAGVSLPGTPLIISRASHHLAWGMTALGADVLDLVRIKLNEDDREQYLTREGWRNFETRRETIQIKGGKVREFDVRTTIWGPVAQKPLLNHPVAIRWTALDPNAINIRFIEIYEAQSLEHGVAIINDTGGPPLNTILVDDLGRIAWTVMGRIPKRIELDGLVSEFWVDAVRDWVDYISPELMPQVIDPPSGFVINANNRSVSKNYPFEIGHAYANGYRAYRIMERLGEMNSVNEQEMFAIQLDTKAGIYGFYRDIALEILTAGVLTQQPELERLRDYLNSWDGTAEPDSLGLAVLVEFRHKLANILLEPLFHFCRMLDEEFEYNWVHLDIPLQALLQEKNMQFLSIEHQQGYTNWDEFLLTVLRHAAKSLTNEYTVQSLHELTWGKVNIAEIAHPLSQGIPGISSILNFPRQSLSGCDFCIKVDSPSFGATQRLVISPTHWQDGILQTPGGQSGHPLSNHYKDLHDAWVRGKPGQFVSDQHVRELVLVPMMGSQ